MTTKVLGRVAPLYKGNYSNSTNYIKFDVVFDGESSFISKQGTAEAPNVGHALTDTTWWGLLCKGNYLAIQPLTVRVTELEADLNGFEKITNEAKLITTTGLYKMSNTVDSQKTLYLNITTDANVLKGTTITLRYYDNTTQVGSEVVYTGRLLTIKKTFSFNYLAVYVGSSDFNLQGNLYFSVSSGVIPNLEKSVEYNTIALNDVQLKDLFESGNLVNKNSIIDGYIINTSGGVAIGGTSSITNAITVKPNTYYTSARLGNFSITINEYTESGAFIRKQEMGVSSETKILTSETTSFVRLQFLTVNKNYVSLFESDSPYNLLAPYKSRFLGVITDNSKELSLLSRKESSTNLIDSNSLFSGVINSDGTVSALATRYYTNRIPILPLTYYTLVNCAVALYNSDDQFIGYATAGASYRYFMPYNVSYGRCTFAVADLNSANFRVSYEIPTAALPNLAFLPKKVFPSELLNYEFIEKYVSKNKLNGYWFNKKLVVDGDSITHDGGSSNYWQYVLANNLSFNSLIPSTFTYNSVSYTIGIKGIAGSRIAVGIENNQKPYALVLRYEELSNDADLVIIAAGTNDWAHNGVKLGVMSDTGVITFYGALHTLCAGLINKYPNKQIVFMTPIKRTDNLNNVNNFGNTLEDYANAIIQVCGYYGIPVCDLFHNLCMNPSIPAQQSLYFNDDTHPNVSGHKKMGNMLTGFIKGLHG